MSTLVPSAGSWAAMPRPSLPRIPARLGPQRPDCSQVIPRHMARKGVTSMKTALAAAILATMLLATTAQAATDPRKCGFSTDPKACARQAAENALKLNMSRRDHVGWSAVINCAPVSPWLVWRCTFRNAVENGSATITFRALANGWHTRVALAS